MADVALAIDGLAKRFGGVVAVDGVSLTVERGGIHALIGPNGAGKTTIIHQLSGALAPDAGRIVFEGRDVTRVPFHDRVALGLARSFQITSIFHDFSTLDNVALAVQAHAGHSFRFWRAAREDAALIQPAMQLLELVRLERKAHVLAAKLSHGEHRQLEIAMALATQPRLLLLDEPVAGMGTKESARMVRFLETLKGNKTIVLVEHDMDAVFSLADRISVLVYGRIVATGTPAEIRANAEVRASYLGEED